MEKTATQRATIGELVAHNLMWNIPANEYAGQETYNGQEYLTSDKVEPVEQGLPKDGKDINRSQ
jgi:hypothetical protein